MASCMSLYRELVPEFAGPSRLHARGFIEICAAKVYALYKDRKVQLTGFFTDLAGRNAGMVQLYDKGRGLFLVPSADVSIAEKTKPEESAPRAKKRRYNGAGFKPKYRPWNKRS